MRSSIGAAEILIVLVLALVVLGPGRLPEAGRGIGRGLREFKDNVNGQADEKGRRRGGRSRTGELTTIALPRARAVS